MSAVSLHESRQQHYVKATNNYNNFHLCRGLATGIYTTNSPEACQYVAERCRASVIVVENNQQLQKILQVKANLPCLKAIVQYTGEVAVREDFIYSVSSWGCCLCVLVVRSVVCYCLGLWCVCVSGLVCGVSGVVCVCVCVFGLWCV